MSNINPLQYPLLILIFNQQHTVTGLVRYTHTRHVHRIIGDRHFVIATPFLLREFACFQNHNSTLYRVDGAPTLPYHRVAFSLSISLWQNQEVSERAQDGCIQLGRRGWRRGLSRLSRSPSRPLALSAALAWMRSKHCQA